LLKILHDYTRLTEPLSMGALAPKAPGELVYRHVTSPVTISYKLFIALKIV